MTLGEIIQRIQSLYSKGVQSSSTRLSARHIYNKLLSVRSRLITQKVNKKQMISTWSHQVIECAELIKAPISECPCLPSNACNILRTKHKLPKPITSLDKHVISSVSTLDGETMIDPTTWALTKYGIGNKYTSTKPGWYIKDEYMYITNLKVLKAITIMGLFDDPTEVVKFPSACCETEVVDDCDCMLDKPFPIDSDLIDPMIELSVTELIEVFNANKEDITNDARDNLAQETKS